MNITFDNFHIDEFYITRTHGINALDELICAQNLLDKHQTLLDKSNAETPQEKYQNALATDSQVKSIKEASFRHLSKTVILYQSSMESIIALAESHNSTLEENLSGVNGFKNRWEAALAFFNESLIEFKSMKQNFIKI